MKRVKVVFLDRDGVINKYPGHGKYVTSAKEFRLIKGVVRAIKILKDAGYRLFVISNQAGVAKGLYSKDDLRKMDNLLKEELKKVNTSIDEIYYCTHTKEQNCICRKPKLGLINRARCFLKKKREIMDRKNSFFIGDSLVDIETARKAKVKSILVFSGKEQKKNLLSLPVQPDFTAQNLAEAVRIIVKQ
ncbi:MAG: HAD-IIIA family hydrolase [Candidatus Omnitrophica bacterium]|nr:HAD-IIIA family hydrolase [Candidatus Omnitrophota bacterium]